MDILSFLYHKAKAKHTKLSNRLVKNLRTGRFEEYTPRKKHQVLQNLEKQRSKFSRLSLQLAVATGVGLSGVAISDQARAQGVQDDGLGPFTEMVREDHPLPAPIQINPSLRQHFDIADIDGDGDQDLYVAGYTAGTPYLYFFENLQADRGTSEAIFKERQNFSFSLNFSFDEIFLSFIDADGDTDLDLYLARGSISQPNMFFRNEGTPSLDLSNFVDRTSSAYDIFGSDLGFTYGASITAVDIDEDGDLDFFVGTEPLATGVIFLYNDAGVLTNIPHSLNDVDLERTQPAFIDIDNDGDHDAFISERFGNVYLFRNDDIQDGGGIDNYDNFVQDNALNPLNGIDFGDFTKIDVSDVDDDGDLDLVVGFSDPYSIPGKSNYHGTNFRTFINDGSLNFTEVYSLENPFGGVDVRYNAAPNLIDIDDDGDLDTFIGSRYGTIKFFHNDDIKGFEYLTGASNPLGNFNYGTNVYGKPELVDIDNDGDLDAYIGSRNSSPGFYLFYNSGLADSPTFDFPNNTSNSLYSLVQSAGFVNGKVYPVFGDMDKDGDLDAFVGGIEYTSYFFENTLTPPSPLPVDTPPLFIAGVSLGDINVSESDALELADLDHDGDLDVYSVRNGSQIDAFQQTTFPNFTSYLPSNTSNHLYEVNSSINGDFNMNMDIVDYDDDGDLDIFFGDINGHIRIFENINLPLDVSLGGASLNITENDPAVPAFSIAGIVDQDINDNSMIVEVEVEIPGFVPGEASISFTDQSGIVGDKAGTFLSTGIYKLEGSATFADYITAINASLTYQELGADPPGSRIIELRIRDSDYTTPNVYSKTVNITAINDPPSITSTAGTTATEDIAYAYTAAVTDLDDANDGVELTWSLSGEPTGMTVSSIGEVSWTPPEGVLTSGAVTLTVQDGGEDGALPSSEVFTLTVTPVNDPPSITSTAGTAAVELELYTYTPVVVDPDDINDGTNLTWSLSGEPAGMTVDALGVVSWTPAVGVTTSGSVTLSVQDGGEDGAVPFSEVFVITVLPAAGNVLPVISGSTGDLAYRSLTGAIIVDDQISLIDTNDADLVGATVTVTSGYSPGEDVLAFTDQNGITGTFNSVTGILTLTGTSSITNYENALRSITYENTAPLPSAASKTIEFIVSDAVEAGMPFARTIVIASNQVIAEQVNTQAEVGTDLTIDVISGATFTIGDIITTTITSVPSFGTAVVNADGTILYTPFNNDQNGDIDVITYELCNEFLSCGSNDINITINNDPPNASIPNTQIEPKGVATVALAPGIADPNGNLDLNSLTVLEVRSGLPVSIDTDLNLTVDYSGSNFTGADRIDIEICDLSGACSVFEVVIEVGPITSVLVYNGVTPNNDGINDVLRILDVEFFPENEMIVYNKLGNTVYQVQNYDNEPVVFSGIGDDGNELENGTYYYVIILDPNGEKIRQSGYIVLKRN